MLNTPRPASGGTRTLATCAALFCAALFLFAAVFVITRSVPAALWICAGAAVTSAIVFLIRRRRLFALSLILSCILAAAFAFSSLLPVLKLEGVEGEFVIRADSSVQTEYGTAVVDGTLLSIDGNETRRVHLRLFLYDATPPEYQAGDKITVTARASLSRSTNRLSQNNIVNLTQSGTLELTPLGADTTLCKVRRFSEAFGARILELMPSREGALLCALLTGDRDHFDGEFESELRRSGLAHIAAVSGMHVSIITALLCLLAGKRVGIALSLLCLPLFAAMTGFSPSVIRAVIMGVLASIAFLSRSQYDPLTAIFSAAAILASTNPFVLFSVSFLLSFASTFGIITVGVRLSYFLQTRLPSRHPLQHLFARLGSAFAISVAASAFTLPLQLAFFSEVSLSAVLSNLLAVWAVPWAMFMGIFLVPLCLLAPFASGVLAFPLALPLRHIVGSVMLMGGKLALTARSDNIFLIIASVSIMAFALVYYRGKISGKGCTLLCLLAGVLCLSLSMLLPVQTVYLYGRDGYTAMTLSSGGKIYAVNAPVSYGGRQFLEDTLGGHRAEVLIITDPGYPASGAAGDVDTETIYSPAPLEGLETLVYTQSGVLELGKSRAELIHTGESAALRLITPRCTLLDVTAVSPFDELSGELSSDLLVIDAAFAAAPAALRYLCASARPSVVLVSGVAHDMASLREICGCEVIALDECESVKIN